MTKTSTDHSTTSSILSYEEYMKRYFLIHSNLKELYLLNDSFKANLIPEKEYASLTKNVAVQFDCANIDFAELLRVKFIERKIDAYISHELLPKTVYFSFNVDGFIEKVTDIFIKIPPSIIDTIRDRACLKLIPALTHSPPLGLCPSEILIDVQTEVEKLQIELNEFLIQNNIKYANQILGNFEKLISCMNLNKSDELKKNEFRQWQDQNSLSESFAYRLG